jgi:hypothetical protein
MPHDATCAPEGPCRGVEASNVERRTFNVPRCMLNAKRIQQDVRGRGRGLENGGPRSAVYGRLLLHVQNANEERSSYGMELSYGSSYFPSPSPSSSFIDRIGA